MEKLIEALALAASLVPDGEDSSVDYAKLLKAIYTRLGDERLDLLLELVRDASDSEMRSPK